MLSLEAAEELRHHTLGEAGRGATPADQAAASEHGPLVQTPDRELVRPGPDQQPWPPGRGRRVRRFDPDGLVRVDRRSGLAGVLRIRADPNPRLAAPGWSNRDRSPPWCWWAWRSSCCFLVLLRLLSIVWYLVRYRGFNLVRKHDDLRAEYGLLTRVSSVIPVYRIQLVTVTASLLHRWFDRESIEIETARCLGGRLGPDPAACGLGGSSSPASGWHRSSTANGPPG